MLTDAQWARLAPLLPGREGNSGGRRRNNHPFVEAVRWLARNGPDGGPCRRSEATGTPRARTSSAAPPWACLHDDRFCYGYFCITT